MKLDFRKSNLVIANFDISPRNGCGDSIITFTNTSYNGKHYRWYLDGVLKDTTQNFKDTLPLHSSYEMKLVAIDSSHGQGYDASGRNVGRFTPKR